jgi:hypothetical protein
MIVLLENAIEIQDLECKEMVVKIPILE